MSALYVINFCPEKIQQHECLCTCSFFHIRSDRDSDGTKIIFRISIVLITLHNCD
uniref:Uncharacterized protein n=1 Tax=Anguilla anguilla TaxID=7936 RepID=A0A0E9V963_ANGAN